MNKILSYCGLVDTRISASEKDLPVMNDHYREKREYTDRNIKIISNFN